MLNACNSRKAIIFIFILPASHTQNNPQTSIVCPRRCVSRTAIKIKRVNGFPRNCITLILCALTFSVVKTSHFVHKMYYRKFEENCVCGNKYLLKRQWTLRVRKEMPSNFSTFGRVSEPKLRFAFRFGVQYVRFLEYNSTTIKLYLGIQIGVTKM